MYNLIELYVKKDKKLVGLLNYKNLIHSRLEQWQRNIGETHSMFV